MKDPAAILSEMNSLYRELTEMELGTSRLAQKPTDRSLETLEKELLSTIDETQTRRDEIMSAIMRLNHEYLQIVLRKP